MRCSDKPLCDAAAIDRPSPNSRVRLTSTVQVSEGPLRPVQIQTQSADTTSWVVIKHVE